LWLTTVDRLSALLHAEGDGRDWGVHPPDLERKLNRENACAWARTIFFSPLFVTFAKQILIENLENGVEIGLQVFFKIVVTDEGAKQDSEVVNE
jgi:hypothetical protein